MKIHIPHIHKIEGDIGFWAEVTRKGKVEKLKTNTLLGLRQIEGILVGRKVKDVPIIVSRICGICPVVHILNGICAIEKALNVSVPLFVVLLRKLMLISQIIQSHALHLFFMALPDFYNIENDLDLMKKFPKEAECALKIRDFSLKITKLIGGREVHPITPRVGGFSKLPPKEKLKEFLKDYKEVLEAGVFLAERLKKVSYPRFQRKTLFASLFSEKEYPFYQADIVKIGKEKITIGDFYSNKIEEDLKNPPVKRVKFRGKSYMLGAIARVKNNSALLNPEAKKILKSFKKENLFDNIFHNLFFQGVEIVHFIEESKKIIEKTLKEELNGQELSVLPKKKKTTGLSAMEAPRGTLFDYIEIDSKARISSCNIITPSAQFLNNLEKDLEVFLPKIIKLPKKQRTKKLRSLVRIYDPCISCATH